MKKNYIKDFFMCDFKVKNAIDYTMFSVALISTYITLLELENKSFETFELLVIIFIILTYFRWILNYYAKAKGIFFISAAISIVGFFIGKMYLITLSLYIILGYLLIGATIKVYDLLNKQKHENKKILQS